MRLKLYCNRYTHFKDALVCSVNCAYRTRCKDFALFYGERRAEVDAVVADYFARLRKDNESAPSETKPRDEKKRKDKKSEIIPPFASDTFQRTKLVQITPAAQMPALIRLEVKRIMSESSFIWVGADDRAELVTQDEVLRRASSGAKPKHIFKVAQEMELRFQLVPRAKVEKARSAAKAEAEATAGRAAARRAKNANNAPPAPQPAPNVSESAANSRLSHVARRAKSRAEG